VKLPAIEKMNENEGSRVKRRAVIEFLIAREYPRPMRLYRENRGGKCENALSWIIETFQGQSINHQRGRSGIFILHFPKIQNAVAHITRQSLKFISQRSLTVNRSQTFYY